MLQVGMGNSPTKVDFACLEASYTEGVKGKESRRSRREFLHLFSSTPPTARGERASEGVRRRRRRTRWLRSTRMGKQCHKIPPTLIAAAGPLVIINLRYAPFPEIMYRKEEKKGTEEAAPPSIFRPLPPSFAHFTAFSVPPSPSPRDGGQQKS